MHIEKSGQYGYGSIGQVKQCIQGVSPRVEETLFPEDLCKATKGLNKNTTARLQDINGMLARFPAPDNRLMADGELCDILYQMVKHKWCKALQKSGCSSSEMSVTNIVNYFEQIELLDVIDKKSLRPSWLMTTATNLIANQKVVAVTTTPTKK
eukprot:3037274-Ditylum_brightwellii.AAC.1